MKTKHTPGEWNITKPNGIHAVIRADDKEQTVIAHVQYDRDAAIITAAPELLAALVAIIEDLDAVPGFTPKFDVIAEARAAIRKATGEA